MNNKLITYEHAKERLKDLERRQRLGKYFMRSYTYNCIASSEIQKELAKNRREINMLLSIIHAHKQARKYYGKMKKLYSSIQRGLDVKDLE